MRFLNTILRDARRPLSQNAFRLQRSALDGVESESPAPPLEEQEDGTMTVYRRSKTAAPIAPAVPERGPSAGDMPAVNAATPFAERTPSAPQHERSESSSHTVSEATDTESFSVRGLHEPDRERDNEAAMPMSVLNATETSLPLEHPQTVGPKRLDSVPVHDPSDPALERSIKSSQERVKRTFPRQNPGVGTDPQPDAPTEPAAPSQRWANDNAARPDTAYSTASAAAATRVATRTDSTPAADSPPAPRSPRVHIGQVDVVVVRQDRQTGSSPAGQTGAQARAADKAASRRFLSRHYLRRL